MNVLLVVGLIIVGAGALWLVAQALILGGGLLEQALEWVVAGRRQNVALKWPWEETDQDMH